MVVVITFEIKSFKILICILHYILSQFEHIELFQKEIGFSLKITIASDDKNASLCRVEVTNSFYILYYYFILNY